MENLNQEIQTTHFRYLREDAIKNPFSFVKEFCFTETNLELFRQDITALISAAMTRRTDNNGKFYKNSDEYVYNHRKIIEVIEALWLLHHQPLLEFTIEETHPLYQTMRWKRDGIDVEARLDSAAKYYRKLENKEVNNIRLFLNDLFLYSDIIEWRETLDDLLAYAHTDESIAHGSTHFSREIIPIAEYLEKVAEAIFLIAELTIKKNQEFTNDNKKTLSNSIRDTPTQSPNTIPVPLADDSFTDNLAEYLHKFWSHLEEGYANYYYGPVLFSEALEKELLSYFETFHPKFLARNFRRVYHGYLEHVFQTGTPFYQEEMNTFIYAMDSLFELLDVAESETEHWPQENRLGQEEV